MCLSAMILYHVYKVVFDATNLSDHLPIQFCLAMQVRSTVIRCQNILSKNLDGIKAICAGITGELLSKLCLLYTSDAADE